MQSSDLWDELEFRAKELNVGGIADVSVDRELGAVVFREEEAVAVYTKSDKGWDMRLTLLSSGEWFLIPDGCSDDREMLDKVMSADVYPEYQKALEEKAASAVGQWREIRRKYVPREAVTETLGLKTVMANKARKKTR